jgi:hypothetical protein
MFRSAGCSLLRAEGFSFSLKVLYGGLRISKLQFDIKKYINFFQFLAIKTLDPDWIRIGIHPKMLDPDSMNTDPKHCSWIPNVVRRTIV